MTRALPRHKADPPATNAANPVELLQYAVNNGVQPAQLKELMDLANAWQDREAARVFGDRFAGFQEDCPPIVKSRQVKNKDGSHRYLFASLDDVDHVVRPILARYGLSVSGTVNTTADAINVRWTVQCGSHKEHRDFALPKVNSGGIVQGCNGVQDLGAWLSYLRRYTLCMALNVVVTDEDTDANALGDVLLLDQEQRKQIDDWIATGIIKPDGTTHKLTEKGLLKWLQGGLPEAERSIDTLTQDDFQRIVTTFRTNRDPKGGAAS